MNMENKKYISIVITAYNVENYILECLTSIINQDYDSYEVLVIDDGSTDNTSNICLEMQNKDSRIKYIRQNNQGVSVARNTGIEKACGKYICFVDGDDYLPQHAISNLVREIDEDFDIVCGDYIAFGIDYKKNEVFFTDQFIADDFSNKKLLFKQLMNGNYGRTDKSNATAIGVPWGKLYKLDFLLDNKLFFDPELKRMQDNIFNMHSFDKAHKIKYVHECCYAYRIAHVKAFGFGTPLNIWEKILEERNRFSQKHKNEWDLELIHSQQYEENIALISSIGYIVTHFEKKEIYNELEKLRNCKIYSNVSKYHFSKCSIKFFPIRALMKMRLYRLLYCFFKTLILKK